MKLTSNCSRRVFSILLCMTMLLSLAYAEETTESEEKHYMGSVINTGKDNGYSEKETIDKDDPHYGWTLGNFYTTGYTRVVDGDTKNPIFLKNVGDTVTLWFELEQNINKLNGDDHLKICEDTNGYYESFGIEKTNLKKGALLVRYTDPQNKKADPVIYTNYLKADAEKDASVEVQLCEEGDYEVVLLYEIEKIPFEILGLESPISTYTNYKISFKFSVRNGNCMVFPRDSVTQSELTNTAFTENGFWLDFANSQYLNVDIKKEIWTEGAEGLSEDIRFNRPAKDGEEYTEEGIYTITVYNQYTEQTTVKKIYVGTNDILKAHVTTGISITEIQTQVNAGATIAEDGTIIPPAIEEEPDADITEAPTPTPEVEDAIVTSTPVPTKAEKKQEGDGKTAIIVAVILGLCAAGIVVFMKSKNNKGESTDESDEMVSPEDVNESEQNTEE